MSAEAPPIEHVEEEAQGASENANTEGSQGAALIDAAFGGTSAPEVDSAAEVSPAESMDLRSEPPRRNKSSGRRNGSDRYRKISVAADHDPMTHYYDKDGVSRPINRSAVPNTIDSSDKDYLEGQKILHGNSALGTPPQPAKTQRVGEKSGTATVGAVSGGSGRHNGRSALIREMSFTTADDISNARKELARNGLKNPSQDQVRFAATLGKLEESPGQSPIKFSAEPSDRSRAEVVRAGQATEEAAEERLQEAFQEEFKERSTADNDNRMMVDAVSKAGHLEFQREDRRAEEQRAVELQAGETVELRVKEAAKNAEKPSASEEEQPNVSKEADTAAKTVEVEAPAEEAVTETPVLQPPEIPASAKAAAAEQDGEAPSERYADAKERVEAARKAVHEAADEPAIEDAVVVEDQSGQVAEEEPAKEVEETSNFELPQTDAAEEAEALKEVIEDIEKNPIGTEGKIVEGAAPEAEVTAEEALAQEEEVAAETDNNDDWPKWEDVAPKKPEESAEKRGSWPTFAGVMEEMQRGASYGSRNAVAEAPLGDVEQLPENNPEGISLEDTAEVAGDGEQPPIDGGEAPVPGDQEPEEGGNPYEDHEGSSVFDPEQEQNDYVSRRSILADKIVRSTNEAIAFNQQHEEGGTRWSRAKEKLLRFGEGAAVLGMSALGRFKPESVKKPERRPRFKSALEKMAIFDPRPRTAVAAEAPAAQPQSSSEFDAKAVQEQMEKKSWFRKLGRKEKANQVKAQQENWKARHENRMRDIQSARQTALADGRGSESFGAYIRTMKELAVSNQRVIKEERKRLKEMFKGKKELSDVEAEAELLYGSLGELVLTDREKKRAGKQEVKDLKKQEIREGRLFSNVGSHPEFDRETGTYHAGKSFRKKIVDLPWAEKSRSAYRTTVEAVKAKPLVAAGFASAVVYFGATRDASFINEGLSAIGGAGEAVADGVSGAVDAVELAVDDSLARFGIGDEAESVTRAAGEAGQQGAEAGEAANGVVDVVTAVAGGEAPGTAAEIQEAANSIFDSTQGALGGAFNMLGEADAGAADNVVGSFEFGQGDNQPKFLYDLARNITGVPFPGSSLELQEVVDLLEQEAINQDLLNSGDRNSISAGSKLELTSDTLDKIRAIRRG